MIVIVETDKGGYFTSRGPVYYGEPYPDCLLAEQQVPNLHRLAPDDDPPKMVYPASLARNGQTIIIDRDKGVRINEFPKATSQLSDRSASR